MLSNLNGDRWIVVDWMISVCLTRKWKPDIICLAVDIFDRFLSKVTVGRNKLQLVAGACIWIAIKYESRDLVSEVNFLRYIIYLTKDIYSKEDFIDAESLICNALEFRFTVPTAVQFAYLYLQELDDMERRRLAEGTLAFILIALLSPDCLEYKPSEIASGALYLAHQRCKLEYEGDLNEQCVIAIHKLYRAERDYLKTGARTVPGKDCSFASKQFYEGSMILEVAKYLIE